MGMLDGLIGSALGGMLGQGQQTQNPLLQMALQLLQQNGGIEGVLDKFRQGGYADQAASWQSTGQNIPCPAAHCRKCWAPAPSARSRSSSECRMAKPPADWRKCCRSSSTDSRRTAMFRTTTTTWWSRRSPC